jgi:hypothetical protein
MRSALAAGQKDQEAYFRNQSILHYERGMMLDLNDFFPSSNLPRLYRARDGKGDQSRAETALHVTIAACERALARATESPWVRPTLLSVAFDIPDADKAEEIAERVEAEGADSWALETTLLGLDESVLQVADDALRARLSAVLTRLKRLVVQ